jgi:excisionase family DNA binding protein
MREKSAFAFGAITIIVMLVRAMPISIDNPNRSSAESGMEMLTVREASQLLRVCPSLVYALCARHVIEHHRCGLGRGAIRISQKALLEYLERSRTIAKCSAQSSARDFSQLNAERLAEAWTKRGVL